VRDDDRADRRDAETGQILRALAEQGLTGPIVEIDPPDEALAEAARAAGFEYSATDMELSGLAGKQTLILRGTLGRAAEPARLLHALATCVQESGLVRLLVAEPNAGHHVRAIRLLTGRSLSAHHGDADAVPTRPFTGADLAGLLEQYGWQLAARYDLTPDAGAGREAESLALAPTLAGDVLRAVGATFYTDTAVSHFVWVLRPAPPAVATTEPAQSSTRARAVQSDEDHKPLVSILMRTQGLRSELMIEALSSIYAQSCDQYEVLVGFHDPGGQHPERRGAVEEVILSMPAPLQRRLRVIECHEPGRGAPLNAMLEQARGVYASILDDDDLLFDHHVETIRQGVEQHGAQVLFQTFAAQRLLDPVRGAGGAGGGANTGGTPGYPYTVHGMSVPWAVPFDPIQQHFENLVPICCLAIPMALVQQTRLRFRTDLDVAEEWTFWMEAMQVLRVVTLPEITAAVNHWNDSSSNAMLRPDLAAVWRNVRDTRHADAGEVPILLDGRTRARLAEAGRQAEELAWLRQQLQEREARLAGIQRSRLWRLARAVWWARGELERARRRLKR
jgi:hypothetical protein